MVFFSHHSVLYISSMLTICNQQLFIYVLYDIVVQRTETIKEEITTKTSGIELSSTIEPITLLEITNVSHEGTVETFIEKSTLQTEKTGGISTTTAVSVALASVVVCLGTIVLAIYQVLRLRRDRSVSYSRDHNNASVQSCHNSVRVKNASNTNLFETQFDKPNNNQHVVDIVTEKFNSRSIAEVGKTQSSVFLAHTCHTAYDQTKANVRSLKRNYVAEHSYLNAVRTTEVVPRDIKYPNNKGNCVNCVCESSDSTESRLNEEDGHHYFILEPMN
ncbi:uncharacterized protein LOC123540849 [Mercenaria mercenaria]|uniref:uncharacterized protein LOC123540849 n=1 Tax=Mercenaria mercenaria TaxID=6596 RepID=UPI00234E88F7|nr:uncharacterized protein LOC123540849 [Mercenaria mercenaria]